MPYLKSATEIRSIILELATVKTLWIDTEVADYSNRNRRLSLIQISADPEDMTGDSIYLFDVLTQPEIVDDFINDIMMNPDIEKVFHNAKYDLNFLGKNQAEHVTCTLDMAKRLPYYLLPVPNHQLQTLATKLCGFHHIDKQEQTSDWGKRPLTESQIEYAYLDCIYLAQVHRRLLEITQKNDFNPATEDVAALNTRYREIEQEWKVLNSEVEHIKEKIKIAMQAQNISETADFKIAKTETIKLAFSELSQLVHTQGIELDFDITLTQAIKKSLNTNIENLPLEPKISITWRLTSKSQKKED